MNTYFVTSKNMVQQSALEHKETRSRFSEENCKTESESDVNEQHSEFVLVKVVGLSRLKELLRKKEYCYNEKIEIKQLPNNRMS